MTDEKPATIQTLRHIKTEDFVFWLYLSCSIWSLYRYALYISSEIISFDEMFAVSKSQDYPATHTRVLYRSAKVRKDHRSVRCRICTGQVDSISHGLSIYHNSHSRNFRLTARLFQEIRCEPSQGYQWTRARLRSSCITLRRHRWNLESAYWAGPLFLLSNIHGLLSFLSTGLAHIFIIWRYWQILVASEFKFRSIVCTLMMWIYWNDPSFGGIISSRMVKWSVGF